MIKKIIWSTIGLVLSAILIILGGAALIKLFKEGHLVANYTSYVPWGFGVSWYVFLVWLEVGTLLSFAILVYLFGSKKIKSISTIVYLSGFLVLISAVLTIWFDIGRMEQAFDIIFNPHFSSMIALMVFMHIFYSGVIGSELLIAVFANRGNRLAVYLDRTFGWIPGAISIVAGMVLISIIASLFSTVSGMTAWRTGSLPLLFLLSSLTAGSAFLNIIYIAFSPDKGTPLYDDVLKLLSKTTLSFIVISTIAGFGVSITLRTSVIDAYFTGGINAIWALFLGFIIPGVLFIFNLLKNISFSRHLVTIASLLMILSLWVVPYNIIVSPQMIEPIPGTAEAFPHEKLSFNYSPSWTELALCMLPLGIAFLGFVIGYWILYKISPMKPTTEEV